MQRNITSLLALFGLAPLFVQAYLRDILTPLPSTTNWQIKDLTHSSIHLFADAVARSIVSQL